MLASGRIRRGSEMNGENTEIAILEDSQLDDVAGGGLAAIAAANSGSLAGLWYLLTNGGDSKNPYHGLTTASRRA